MNHSTSNSGRHTHHRVHRSYPTRPAVVDSDTGTYEQIPGRRLALAGVALVAAAGAVGTFLVAVGMAGTASADDVTDPRGRDVPSSAMAGWVDPGDPTTGPGGTTVPPGPPLGAATPWPGTTPAAPGATPLPGAAPMDGAPADGIAAVGVADDLTPDGVTATPAPATSGPVVPPDADCPQCDRDVPGQGRKSTPKPTRSDHPNDGRPAMASPSTTFTSADALSTSTSGG